MELRKIIVYSIFVVAVIYGIYFHFLSGETVKKIPEPVRTESPIQATISAPVEDGHIEPKLTIELDKIPKTKNKTRRNPFKKSEPASP
jgi:hypothetical protein